MVRRLSEARRRGPQCEHDAGQQEGRPLEHRREGDGVHRQVGQLRHLRRAVAGREGEAEGLDLRIDARERFHLRQQNPKSGPMRIRRRDSKSPFMALDDHPANS